jgi:hypothetical protein
MSRGLNEERLGALLRILRPAPRGWIQAAQELPGARSSLDEIVARAEADLEFRAALIADLETALEQAGFEPDRRIVSWLEQRLAQHPDQP